ncbi:MAG: hypothetical protein P8Y68_02685 [Anaerolineales bacterium]|jgi:enamine deaminase RidA (YjgF/YER057c/UK114 family)
MQRVEICIEGQIDKAWSEWFEGFSVTHTPRNETIITGEVPDQSALYGMITKLRDLGLKLISVNSQEMDC